MPGTSIDFFSPSWTAEGFFSARFNVTTDFAPGFTTGEIAMPIDSNDDLPRRRAKFQIKDVIASCFLPICYNSDTPPVLITTATQPFGVHHRYTFWLNFNGWNIHIPVAFNWTVDRVQISNILARTQNQVQELSCMVWRDFINPAWAGAGKPVTLSLIIHGFTF